MSGCLRARTFGHGAVMAPNQRSKIGKKPGRSLNLHLSWCRFIKTRSNPPGECNVIQNRSSLQHQIEGQAITPHDGVIPLRACWPDSRSSATSTTSLSTTHTYIPITFMPYCPASCRSACNSYQQRQRTGSSMPARRQGGAGPPWRLRPRCHDGAPPSHGLAGPKG